MKFNYLLTLALSFIFFSVNAQHVKKSSSQRKLSPIVSFDNDIMPNSAGFSGTGSNIDVVYNRIQWSVNPNLATNTITGTITTYFKTLVNNVTTITLDLNKASFDNGSLNITYHGTACTKTFPTTGNVNIVTITLPASVPIAVAGTLDSLVINYSGIPPTPSGGIPGYQKLSYTDASSVTQNYIGSVSESYEDRNWWPCKADMQDKIDSMDIQVTVPWTGVDTFWVASNGVLMDSAIIGGNRIFKYKTRYPIPSYLVCLSVAKFKKYYRAVNVNGTNVPVQYYLLAGNAASYYTNAVTAMDKMNAVLQAFSTKLTDYPFKNEKHGYYDGLVGASGMEHQTFSAINSGSLTNLTVLIHELMHQWFGDNVSFATWNDLMLAEGFAKWGESFGAELVPSLGLNAYTLRNTAKTTALANTCSAWLSNANIATSNTIWTTCNVNAIYERGSVIVSMLRSLSGDSLFFKGLRNYQNNNRLKAATIDSLRNEFNNVLGMDISEFFKDFVGGSGSGTTAVGGIGNPRDTVYWNTTPNTLYLRQGAQTKSATNNVAYFNMPVVVRATATGKDTTIVYYDWGGGTLSYAGRGLSDSVRGNLLTYPLSFTPTALIYDDSARTLSTGGTRLIPGLTGYIWFGGTDANWNNPANWNACCGVPPVSGADITIATTTNQPTLPANFSVRNLTINTGKNLNIGNFALTVTGSIKGTGTLTGSATSKLVLSGNAGDLNFNQTSAVTRSLSQLTMKVGSSATVATNMDVTNCIIANANLTIKTGATLITK